MSDAPESESNSLPVLYYQKLSDYAFIPKRATPHSVGVDVFAPVQTVVTPGTVTCIPIDLILVPSPGHYLRVASKSGLAVKHNLSFEAGVIDPDYRGNVVIVICNHTEQVHLFERGKPFTQIIQEKVAIPQIKPAPILEDTQ